MKYKIVKRFFFIFLFFFNFFFFFSFFFFSFFFCFFFFFFFCLFLFYFFFFFCYIYKRENSKIENSLLSILSISSLNPTRPTCWIKSRSIISVFHMPFACACHKVRLCLDGWMCNEKFQVLV